ncbi:MAG: alpha/beta fold hydrolase [Brevinematia bacterium]
MKLDIYQKNLSQNKNTILFLPAFPTPKEMYINQIKFLEKENIPFIALNYPGIGKSEKPNKIEMSIKELVEIILDNIKNLPFKGIIPIGTSMGGYVMFEIWRQYKDKVSGFVFCHTRAKALDEESKKKRLSDIEKIQEDKEGYQKTFSQNLVSDYTKENRKEVVEFIDEIIKDTTPEGLSALVYVIATRPDSRELLKEIDVPSLVIGGKDDKIVPIEIVKYIADNLPNATFVEFETSGHMSPLEEPEKFNNILLSFLTDKNLI